MSTEEFKGDFQKAAQGTSWVIIPSFLFNGLLSFIV